MTTEEEATIDLSDEGAGERSPSESRVNIGDDDVGGCNLEKREKPAQDGRTNSSVEVGGRYSSPVGVVYEDGDGSI